MKMDICLLLDLMRKTKKGYGYYDVYSSTLYSTNVEFTDINIIRNVTTENILNNTSIDMADSAVTDINKSYLKYNLQEGQYGYYIEGVPLKDKIAPQEIVYRLSETNKMIFLRMISNMNTALNTVPKFVVEELRGDEIFERFVGIKSSDGRFNYSLHHLGYNGLITIYKSLLNITKKDKVKLEIWDYDYMSDMYRFTIQKSKSLSIEVITRVIKL